MSYTKLAVILLGAVVCTFIATDVNAQGRARGRSGVVVGHAVPRAIAPRVVVPPPVYASRFIRPRVIGVVPYRPYYYPYRPGLTIGFYSGLGGYGWPGAYG